MGPRRSANETALSSGEGAGLTPGSGVGTAGTTGLLEMKAVIKEAEEM